MFEGWTYDPKSQPTLQGGSMTQGSSISLQGGSNPQKTAGGLQVTANPNDFTDPAPNSGMTDTGVAIDPAAAVAAANAAKAAALRSDITSIANRIKDIFNSRYGQVKAAAGEQTGKLQDRFSTESQDLVNQINDENQKVGAAHAASGTYDSSYRGNNVDTVTREGNNQIRDLGTELKDNIDKIAAWVAQQQASVNASKGGVDYILSHLAEETDPDNLSQIRSTLEGRIADLQASSADNNTSKQNASVLNQIAPTSARAVQLKTTLSSIVAGNADASQKLAIGKRLIDSAGLTDDEAKKLKMSFQSDIAASEDNKDQIA